VVDAYIPESKTVIECQGDFWHCNPRMYPNGPKYPTQEKRMERDREKREALTAQGYRFLELWEMDIKEQGAKSLLESALLT